MQLGVMNRIIDDSDSKLADFDRRFQSDLDFNDKIESTIGISIKFRYNFDFN